VSSHDGFAVFRSEGSGDERYSITIKKALEFQPIFFEITTTPRLDRPCVFYWLCVNHTWLNGENSSLAQSVFRFER